MTTEPIRGELLAYLQERHDEALLASWPVQPSADLLPAVRAQAAPVVMPRREVTLFSPDPVAQTAVQAQADVAIALKRASTGLAFAFGGLGFWLFGLGVHQIGAGLKEAGAVSLWAVAAMFMSTAVARVFSPRRTGGQHIEVRGHHNNVRLR